jgi:hypothetical protein
MTAGFHSTCRGSSRSDGHAEQGRAATQARSRVESNATASLPLSTPIHRTTFSGAHARRRAAVTRSWVWHLSSPALSVVGSGAALEISTLSAVAGSPIAACTRRGALGSLPYSCASTRSGLMRSQPRRTTVVGRLGDGGQEGRDRGQDRAPRQTIADFDKRIGQIDEAVSMATKRGRTSSAMDLATAQRNPARRVAGP